MLSGRAANLVYTCRDRDGAPSQMFRTLFLQETIRRGVLAPSLVVCYSHSDDDIDRTVEAIDGALGVYRRALDEGPEAYVVGRPVQPVSYRREPDGRRAVRARKRPKVAPVPREGSAKLEIAPLDAPSVGPPA